jgi:hypothetical protein
VDAPHISASISATAPIPRESGIPPEVSTWGSRRQAQTDKVVTIAETLINELITWKEMIDEGRTAELQVLELHQQLARCEEQLRYKGTTYNKRRRIGRSSG